MKQKNDYTTNTIMSNLFKAVSAKKEKEIKPLSPEVLELVKRGEYMNKYKGNDNEGKPKTDYLQRLVNMNDEQLRDQCETDIWLSAYAANNPRSDYHFMCDACYDECARRGKPEIYTKAHKAVSASI